MLRERIIVNVQTRLGDFIPVPRSTEFRTRLAGGHVWTLRERSIGDTPPLPARRFWPPRSATPKPCIHGQNQQCTCVATAQKRRDRSRDSIRAMMSESSFFAVVRGSGSECLELLGCTPIEDRKEIPKKPDAEIEKVSWPRRREKPRPSTFQWAEMGRLKKKSKQPPRPIFERQ